MRLEGKDGALASSTKNPATVDFFKKKTRTTTAFSEFWKSRVDAQTQRRLVGKRRKVADYKAHPN